MTCNGQLCTIVLSLTVIATLLTLLNFNSDFKLVNDMPLVSPVSAENPIRVPRDGVFAVTEFASNVIDAKSFMLQTENVGHDLHITFTKMDLYCGNSTDSNVNAGEYLEVWVNSYLQ
jgi:hypothetical protein